MSDKYSDRLPRFGRNRFRRSDRGIHRFDVFIRNARLRQGKPKSRPGFKIFAMAIIIGGLAYGVTERNNVMRLMGAKDRSVRFVVPLAIPMRAPPEFSKDELNAAIARVQPKAEACLKEWPDATPQLDGSIEVEILLTQQGPVEAAVIGQQSMPEAIARCVGDALGSQAWPRPKWNRKVRFNAVELAPPQ